MPILPDHIRDWIEAIVLAVLVMANIAKIIVLQRNTVRWNGLGRATRLEKFAYALLFAWILLLPVLPFLDYAVVFVGIAVLVLGAEFRVMRMIPWVRIRHVKKMQ